MLTVSCSGDPPDGRMRQISISSDRRHARARSRSTGRRVTRPDCGCAPVLEVFAVLSSQIWRALRRCGRRQTADRRPSLKYTIRVPSGDHAMVLGVLAQEGLRRAAYQRHERPALPGLPSEPDVGPVPRKPEIPGTSAIVSCVRAAGVRLTKRPVPPGSARRRTRPSRSARNATNLPSGEMSASTSAPSQSVKRVNWAFASGLSTGVGAAAARSQLAAAGQKAQHDDSDAQRRAPAPRCRHDGRRCTGRACRPTAPPGRTPDRAPTESASRALSPGSATTMRSSAGETFVGSGAGGSSFRIAAIVSAAVARVNGRRPAQHLVAASCPTLKMSDRQSTASPRTCSGDM